MTLSGVETMPCALVSSIGISRTTTSVSSMILRAGIVWSATTTATRCSPAWPACCCAWLMRKNAAPPATTARMTPTMTM